MGRNSNPYSKMTKDQIISENHELFNEKEFWKSTAIEQGSPRNAYKVCCKEVEEIWRIMDPDNTGFVHG